MTDPTAPNESAAIGRDALGRFAPGNPGGPGRRPRPDFATVVDAHLARNGGSTEKVLGEVFDGLRAAAAGGDVAAARLLLDRLCPIEKGAAAGRDLEALLAETNRMTDHERASRIALILRTAQLRRASHSPAAPGITVDLPQAGAAQGADSFEEGTS